MAKIPVALQLYSIRADCARDLPGSLKAVADMGYEGVEFAGHYDRSAAELRSMLDDLGLKVAGTHTALRTVLNEELLPTGTVTGRLTMPGGAGVPFASVSLTGATGSVSAGTDFNGNYTVRAYPGEYTVAFQTPHGRQWEDGKSSAAAADPVTVVAHSTITAPTTISPNENHPTRGAGTRLLRTTAPAK